MVDNFRDTIPQIVGANLIIKMHDSVQKSLSKSLSNRQETKILERVSESDKIINARRDCQAKLTVLKEAYERLSTQANLSEFKMPNLRKER